MNVPAADLLFIAVTLLVIIVVPLTLFLLHRRNTAKLGSRLDAIFAAADHTPYAGPQVTIRFHLYSGWLMSFDQVRIEREVPAAAAPQILRSLMLLNLRTLSLYPGALFVPFLTVLEYLRQLRSVRRQLRRLPASVPAAGVSRPR